MKYAWISLLLAALLSGSGDAQTTLFSSPGYSIDGNRVRQGEAVALALSDSELTSTYHSPYRVRTKRLIELKFSLNGEDNERVAGQNHRLMLPEAGGHIESPLYVFGKSDSLSEAATLEVGDPYLRGDAEILFRLDMRPVIRDFRSKGFFETQTGRQINAGALSGVFIAGNSFPLNWDFASLAHQTGHTLQDPDSDGIYEVTVRFRAEESPAAGTQTGHWRLSKDVSRYPAFHSAFPLVNALYTMSLEELRENIRDDGAFMAGAMWPGVWTRDLSYSIILSLAMIDPDASRASLMAKVKDGHIIQDTGTGGSWPVSSDRMVWAVAAWELYKVNGDRTFLRKSFDIIRRSAEEDMHAVRDPSTGLYCGESSFLDWREQTYPRWMDPREIYGSKNLGTNVVHYAALNVLASMAEILGEPSDRYRRAAAAIKKGINRRLWLPDRGYYGQYLYGGVMPCVSPRSEALGEALAILYGVADPSQAASIVRNTPTMAYGIPCIYPQIPGIPAYHNNAIWPFVEAYWGWAGTGVQNTTAVEQALGSMYRSAALFLTNKENIVAATGDYLGTEINSGRQLWSVAGLLGTVHRVLFGMRLTPDSLIFEPDVPAAYAGEMSLRHIAYRQASLDVTLQGSGHTVQSVTLDGVPADKAAIPGSLAGKHVLAIILGGTEKPSTINLVPDVVAPETPDAALAGDTLSWGAIVGAKEYIVLKNGRRVGTTGSTRYILRSSGGYAEYQVAAKDAAGVESFLSKPAADGRKARVLTVQAEDETADDDIIAGFTGKGYVSLQGKPGETLTIPLRVAAGGTYVLEFRYANGNGPINTDNKCAVRSIAIDGAPAGVVVLPQRGDGAWTDWGFSSPTFTELKPGRHTVTLTFGELDANMNREVNAALIDCLRVTLLRPTGR